MLTPALKPAGYAHPKAASPHGRGDSREADAAAARSSGWAPVQLLPTWFERQRAVPVDRKSEVHSHRGLSAAGD